MLRFPKSQWSAAICARFAEFVALVSHFEFCSLLSASHHLGGPISPVLGKTLDSEKVYVYHILDTTRGSAIRLGSGQKFG